MLTAWQKFLCDMAKAKVALHDIESHVEDHPDIIPNVLLMQEQLSRMIGSAYQAKMNLEKYANDHQAAGCEREVQL